MDLFYKRSLKPSVLDYSLTRPHSAETVEGTFAENFRAAANQMFSSGSSGSMGNVLYDAYAPILSHVNKTLKENDIKTENFSKGGFFSNEKDYAGIRNELLHNPAYLMSRSASPLKGYLGKEKHYYSKADALIKTIKDHPDLFPEMQDLTVKEIEKQAIASALKDQATLMGITENSPGFSKMMARFAGGMYQAAQDPPIALSMLISFDPKLALPKVMLREALVGAVSEGIVQERVQKWYDELGLDYSFEDFAQAVATGGVLGFVMPGAFKIGGKSIEMSADWIKRGLDVLGVGQKKLSPIGEGAKELEESINDLANSNPIKNADLPSNKGKHESNLETAKNQLLNNEIVETKPITPDELSDVELNKQVNPDNDQTVFQFDPDEIQVDAKTFQFKEGGDAFGVTSKLRDTKKWDARAAGTITVFERLDGTKFVADGHQRLGLAKRLMSEDPGQNIKMNAFVMREADGITPEFAMVSAAVTNIIRGTGTDLDAAKIYRSNQNLIQTQFADIVPPSSAMFRKAQDLSKLSDENWGMVINKVIPSDFAAVVGRVIPDDPAIQKAAISVLSRSKVDNAFQAEAIARQVKATEMDTSVQTGLFGDEVEVESLFVERAKVLDEAKRIIRKDRSAFNTLVKNSKEFEKGGNQLNELGNKKKVLDDGTMLAMLMASADKKGEISNALTQAAREAKATNRYGQAARSYVEALRRGIEKGDFDSTDFGSSGRSIDLEKDVRDAQPNPQQQAEIERFDDPGSPAAKEQADQLEQEIFNLTAEPLVTTRSLDPKLKKALLEKVHENQSIKSVDDLLNRGAVNHKELSNTISEISKEIGATAKLAPLKSRARIEEKVKQKYRGNLNEVGDVARGGIEASSPKQANKFVKRLSQKYKIVDEGYATTDLGYFDRKLTVLFDNGAIGEVQIWTPGMADAKFGKGDELYRIYRDKTKPITARRRAAKESKILFNTVLNKLDKSWLDELSSVNLASSTANKKLRIQNLRAEANKQRFGDAQAEEDAFKNYLDTVNPSGKIIDAKDRPNLNMGDMYGMLPDNATKVKTENDITFHKDKNGNYYATAFNPDLNEEDVVGYIINRGNETELAVVSQMQKKGIGGELQFLYRTDNPNAPTGGLTKAGEKLLRNTFKKLDQKGIAPPASSINDLKSSAVISGDLGSPRTSPGEISPKSIVEGEKESILPGSGSYAGILPSTKKNLIDTSTTNISPNDPLIKGFDELDPDLELPFSFVDKNGNESFIPQTVKSLKDEFENDKNIMDRLDYCTV